MRISDWSSDVCSSDLLPILGHAIMGRHLRSRVGHPLYGGCCISHAGIMQHQHGDWQLPLIEIGRGRVDHTESLGNGIWPALRMVTMATPPSTITPPNIIIPVTGVCKASAEGTNDTAGRARVSEQKGER